ncbi:MAG: M15 family metallopeptidase [Chloroflexota bacterium]
MLPTSRTAAPARLAAVAAVVALLALLVVGPALGPASVQAMGPLPACRYDDILTTPRGYADWPMTLVDTILRVPKGYVPPDLVSTAQAGIAGGGKVRAVMIDDLRAMSEAAAAAGNGIGIESAYRSYASQQDVFNSWVKRFGYKRALEVSARPGHSEHQLGLAIDFRSDPGGSPFTGTWNTTPAGKWMKAHAWEYGFVMSYPKGTMAVTCYDYEPWHYRYLGRDLAAKVHASGLTQRAYLWAHFTTTVVPPAPTPTKAPAKTARPTATPVPSPSVSPSSAPTASPVAPTATPMPPPPLASARPTPSATEAPADPTNEGGPVVLAGLGVGLAAVASGAWLLRRRGRSGVGL